MNGQTNRQIEGKDGCVKKWTNKQIHRKVDGWINKQTERERWMYKEMEE